MNLVFLFASMLFFSSIEAGWSHLELGAGNYGQDGHTKASQSMTVLKKLKEVTSAKNYIDDLEEVGHGNYKPEEQYGVLFWTLDELVRRYGDQGTFYVNDLYEEYALFATEKLKEYAVQKGYASIRIEAYPGDFLTLGAQEKFSTVHLKNPETSLFYDKMDGDCFFASEQARREARLMFQRVADISETGLYLFILDNPDFIPPEEKQEFMDRQEFYHPTQEWPSVLYIFPEGTTFPAPGIVLHIRASN